MNSHIGFDTLVREENFGGVHNFPEGWSLKIFFITAKGIPFAPQDKAIELIDQMLKSINGRMSPEFLYGRFGFVIVHTGRRGVCITIWHFGAWGTTFEFFSSVWYRYGYGFDNFELLNDVEPAFCWFEMKRTTTEIQYVFDLAQTMTMDAIKRKYVSSV